MKVAGSELLSALASGAMDDASPEEKQLALVRIGGEIVDGAVSAHLRDGVEMSPLLERYYRVMLRILSESPAHERRVQLLRALEENITSTVLQHHKWRHARNSNVVWEWSGPTGSGKSSAALGLLERFNRVEPAKLAEHVTIDTPALPHILPKLGKGSGVLVDEQTKSIGEGSVSQAKLLRNIEDQIRYAEVDIYWASPESEDHSTSQGEFVAIGANPDRKFTRFLVYLYDTPLGHANLPWCSEAMWAAYEPIKRANVDRALRATFQNPDIQDEMIRRLFTLRAVQAACRIRRLKTADWRRFLKRFGLTLNTSQVQTMAEEIEFMLDTILLRPHEFATIYGWEPTQEMKTAAHDISATRG